MSADRILLCEKLIQIGYSIKKHAGKTISVLCADRLSAIEDIKEKIEGTIYDPDAPGSSIGAIYANGIKILIKSSSRSRPLEKEEAAIRYLQESIDRQVEQTGKAVTIVLPHKEVSVTGVSKVAGNAKADFSLIDEEGKPVVFISHKNGTKASDFQQYSGLTEPEIRENPIVKDFIKDVKELVGDKINPGSSIVREITNVDAAKDLMVLSIYGTDSNTSDEHGTNKCDILAQGMLGVVPTQNGRYSLTCTGSLHYYPEIPAGKHTPALAIVYKGDRSNFGISGARGSIYPIGGRKFKTHI